jgi:hypothetical protein
VILHTAFFFIGFSRFELALDLQELGNYFADVSDEEINLLFHSILADKEKLTSQLSDLIFQMMDRDASGLIEYSEFVDWAKKSGVFGPVQDRDANDVKLEAKLKRAFSKLDSDQSSAINKDEFRSTFMMCFLLARLLFVEFISGCVVLQSLWRVVRFVPFVTCTTNSWTDVVQRTMQTGLPRALSLHGVLSGIIDLLFHIRW